MINISAFGIGEIYVMPPHRGDYATLPAPPSDVTTAISYDEIKHTEGNPRFFWMYKEGRWLNDSVLFAPQETYYERRKERYEC